MSFTSPALERLRAVRARVAQPEAAPLPAPAPQPPGGHPSAPPELPPPPARPPVKAPPRPQARREGEPGPTHPSAAPEPGAGPGKGRDYPRPDMAARAALRGHCGTCAAFILAPAEGRFMGECAHGWAAHYPGEGRRGLPVVMHEAARCMTSPLPRWAFRAGVKLPEVDSVTGGAA